MRNPARKALYCLLALLVSAALIRYGAARLERIEEDPRGAGAVALGFAIAPFPLYIFVEALFAMRGRALLLMGKGVIARWQLAPAEWARFRGVDPRRLGEDVSLGNALWIRKRPPAEPVEVIVGEKSALVDGSYHSLKPGGIPDLRGVRWLEGPPTCLEFSLRYPRGRYVERVRATLRIPVPAGARSQAGRVFDHFERLTRPGPGISHRALGWIYGIWTFLILGILVVSAIAYRFVPSLREGSGEFVLIGLLIGSSILAAFSAILVAVAWFSGRRV